ncbi:flagellar export chaperone FlgN [Ectobacillus ponti]|uniref:Uncharacterized protein n=1 Tax=Ectobacillus ponti TaxID=2961894 RepID=A0AA41X9H5_9BACI|nr:flagellar export chaperone FlgN [Ectobacillus ponti]MCP8968835.1 hypothetical protein [Ectobacillus ponti]
MFQALSRALADILACYQGIHENGKSIYRLLQERKLKDVQPFNSKQLQQIQQLGKLQQDLEGIVGTYCKEQNIGELKISRLLPLLAEREQEYIRQLQGQIRSAEADAKRMLLQNQYYLDILLKTTEGIVDFVSDMNRERGHNSQLFMDELL